MDKCNETIEIIINNQGKDLRLAYIELKKGGIAINQYFKNYKANISYLDDGTQLMLITSDNSYINLLFDSSLTDTHINKIFDFISIELLYDRNENIKSNNGISVSISISNEFIIPKNYTDQFTDSLELFT